MGAHAAQGQNRVDGFDPALLDHVALEPHLGYGILQRRLQPAVLQEFVGSGSLSAGAREISSRIVAVQFFLKQIMTLLYFGFDCNVYFVDG